MQQNNKEMGLMISILREERELTQQELADDLNVTKGAVSKWEQGESIKIENIYLISKYFGVTIEELVSGKRNTESNTEYWERMFSLEKYELNGKVERMSPDKILEFYDKCHLAKNKFFQLLPLWALDKLPNGQNGLFKMLNSYFAIDASYWSYVKYGNTFMPILNDSDIKELVKNVALNTNLNDEEKTWEYQKLYIFKYSDTESSFEGLYKDLKLFDAFTKILTKPQLDYLLTSNLKVKTEHTNFITGSKEKRWVDATSKEIEKNGYIDVLLNRGAECLKSLENYSTQIDETEIEHLRGKYKITTLQNENTGKKSYLLNFSSSNKYFDFNQWKLLSINEYKKMIDKEKTEYIKSIIQYKDVNPIKYVEMMEKYYKRNLIK